MIKLKECEKVNDNSKIFGEANLPNEWLENDVFSTYEIFFCQIDLSELKNDNTLLPKKGHLFFFIDVERKPKAVVRYFDGELDAVTDFNDGFETEEDIFSEFGLKQVNDDNCGFELGEEKGNEIILLKYIPQKTNLNFYSNLKGEMLFIINKNDLINKDFSKVKLIIKGNFI